MNYMKFGKASSDIECSNILFCSFPDGFSGRLWRVLHGVISEL